MQFNIKIIKPKNIINEIKNIGFDPSYVIEGAKKHSFLNIKISDIKPYISTIIKESALSNGCDAAVHRGVLKNEIEKSDLILSGSIKSIKNTIKSLEKQPFGLKDLSKKIDEIMEYEKKEYSPKIMGILNITENSFSDGGKFLDPKNAINHGKKLIDEGADIIDIGGESTAPNRDEIKADIEIKRILPVVRELKKAGIKISIDTRHSMTAKAMADEGVDIINDVSGLEFDDKMIDVIKNSNAKICLVHSIGTPENMDSFTQYKDVRKEVYNYLSDKINYLIQSGISKERIIADVGFGFAKNVEQNFELLSAIQEFNSLNVKTLSGVSRKRFLKSLVKEDEIDDITMLSSFYLMENKVDIIRVHDVRKTKIALEFYKKLYT